MKTAIAGLAMGAGLLLLKVSWLVVIALLAISAALCWALRRVVSRAGGKSIAALPDRISLAGEHPAPWRDAPAVATAGAQLLALGFVRAGEYSVPEMPGVLVAGFAHLDESLYAVVYEHPAGLVWTDLIADGPDGRSLTVSNAPEGEQLESVDGKRRVIDAGASTEQLWRRALAEGQAMPRNPVDPSMFRLTLERAYARTTALRKKRPLTRIEVDRFLDKSTSAQRPLKA